ncbi:MAG TPA: hypothetical protein DD473_05050 [Planctomycetaceae bacterium]|nr:hypothetical protein [Planctomycetaceae bacterium]
MLIRRSTIVLKLNSQNLQFAWPANLKPTLSHTIERVLQIITTSVSKSLAMNAHGRLPESQEIRSQGELGNK